MFARAAAILMASAAAQDLFLASKPTRAQCQPASGARLEPSTDAFQQLCYLLYKNGQEYTISWTPPGVPVPALFQDHIPYDLVTLWKLGASAEQLNASYQFHLEHEMLQPLNSSTGRITETNWKNNVGRNPSIPDVDYPDYLDFYRKQLAKNGLEPTLKTYLPSLVGGGFGKLFHGQQMIGWSYAETGDVEMAAQGLAWMSTAFLTPAPLTAHGSRKNLSETFEAMHADHRLPKFQGDPTSLYYNFLKDLFACCADIMNEYDLDISDDISANDAQELAKEMQDASFKLFAAYNYSSFTHIHLVSSSRAIASFMSLLTGPSRAELLRRQWQGILWNYAIQSRPSPVLPNLPTQVRSWAEIVTGTLKQTEYHLHELVFYAKENYCESDSKLMQASADRALALIEGGGKWAF